MISQVILGDNDSKVVFSGMETVVNGSLFTQVLFLSTTFGLGTWTVSGWQKGAKGTAVNVTVGTGVSLGREVGVGGTFVAVAVGVGGEIIAKIGSRKKKAANRSTSRTAAPPISNPRLPPDDSRLLAPGAEVFSSPFAA